MSISVLKFSIPVHFIRHYFLNFLPFANTYAILSSLDVIGIGYWPVRGVFISGAPSIRDKFH